ncbi:KdsC family phosphatase [Butyrivibrio sp. YAB3001]|uniref:KdsC family phosphatase n=1 Tax=Butyrivibrio sp. YAB3001 TaxID=1520812 RepID=UPI0008F62DF8|nr:HAD-IIIA family hydrolase [Butyrivibrio sp. YAB3001]SFC22968.1 3-deoxy-D-manno-octulosonate 8-phosphate phosphatase (KDO 8-P phosphatase) [Butyrivibrio sp. YAB3001]
MQKTIKLIVIDVDGTLTDSGIYYDEHGNEMKKFSTKDAAGFFAAKAVGIKTMILTGRECAATKRRMEEMKVDFLLQNIKDKASFLKEFMNKHGLEKDDVAYVGDDLNDLAPMKLAGYVACPADSCKEVKEIADYVSSVKGGYGAFRDVMEHILERGQWESVINTIYGAGV